MATSPLHAQLARAVVASVRRDEIVEVRVPKNQLSRAVKIVSSMTNDCDYNKMSGEGIGYDVYGTDDNGDPYRLYITPQ